jgi:hypothetical protein
MDNLKFWLSIEDAYIEKIILEDFSKYFRVPVSIYFLDFLNRKMSSLFITSTGLKPSPQLTVSIYDYIDAPISYEKDETSIIRLVVKIDNVLRLENIFEFCWRTKDGSHIVTPDEKDFNENNLECWLQGLNVKSYYAELAEGRQGKLPFSTKGLPYELEIRDYGYSMYLFITNDTTIEDQKSLINTLDNLVNKFNLLAEKRASGISKGTPLQAVHSWNFKHEGNERIKLYLDAASPDILKKILKELAKYPSVTKVELDLAY